MNAKINTKIVIDNFWIGHYGTVIGECRAIIEKAFVQLYNCEDGLPSLAIDIQDGIKKAGDSFLRKNKISFQEGMGLGFMIGYLNTTKFLEHWSQNQDNQNRNTRRIPMQITDLMKKLNIINDRRNSLVHPGEEGYIAVSREEAQDTIKFVKQLLDGFSLPYDTSLSIENKILPSRKVAIAFLWWLICGFLPCLSLYIDFGWSEGLFLAKIYPHFFLFPLLVAFLVPYFLLPAARLAFRITVKKDSNRKLKLSVIAVTLLFLAAFYFTWADVREGDPAMWEFKYLSNLKISDGMRAIDEANDILRYCPEVNILHADRSSENESSECNVRRQRLIQFLKSEQPEHQRSITHLAYTISLFLQVLTLATSLFTLGSLWVYKRVQDLNLFSADKNLSIVFLIYFLWIPVRIFALQEKANLYLNITFLTELPITIFILIAYIYSLLLARIASEDVVTPVLMMLAGVAISVITAIHPHLLSLIIGRSSNPATWPMITVVLLVALLPLLIDDDDGS